MHPAVALIIACLLIAAVVWVAWMALPKPEIIIAIRDRKLEVRKGKAPRQFVEECETLLESLPIGEGTIRGYRRQGGRIALTFSRSIPESEQQRFRNVWNMCGN